MIQNLKEKAGNSGNNVKFDFCWNIGPDYMFDENDENYRKFLCTVFMFNPAAHGFESDGYKNLGDS